MISNPSCASRRSLFGKAAGVGLALMVFASSGAMPSATDKKPDSPPPRRFEVEGGKLDAAIARLSGQLQLTDEQGARVRILMVKRARSFEEQNSAARETFRGKLDSLLTEAQKKKHRWSDAEWLRSDGEGPFRRWGMDKWLTEFNDLTEAQVAELKTLVRQRADAVWAALTRVEKTYEDALASLLTPAQRTTLAAIEAKDPVIHLPTEK